MNLKTTSDVKKKVMVSSSQNKLIEYNNQGNIVTKLLVKLQNKNIDLSELMRFCLTPVPYCIGTDDGPLAKTNKAKGVSF